MAIEERKLYKKFYRPSDDLDTRQLEETESHINRIWKALESMHAGNELAFQQVNNSMMAMASVSGGGSSLPSWSVMADNLYPYMDGHNEGMFLRLDCRNSPLTGPLEIATLSESPNATGYKPLDINYQYDTTNYSVLSLWDDDTWFRLGFWKPASSFPPSMAAYRQFIIRTDPDHANDFVMAVQEDGIDAGRINFYNTSTYISSTGEFHAAGGVFNQAVGITDEDATALVISSGKNYDAIDFYYIDGSCIKYLEIHNEHAYIYFETIDYWFLGGSDEVSGFGFSADAIEVYGEVTFYSKSPDSPPFNLSGNNTGVLVSGLNADLLDGLDSTDFASADHDHDGVYEPALGNPGADGYLLSSTMAGVRSWVAAPSTTHEMLSATHTDSTTGTVVRGDIITGQGSTPKWTRLAKGTAGTILNMGANEPQWSTQATLLGSGTNNYIPKFSVGATPTFTDSVVYESSDIATIDKAPTEIFTSNTTGVNYVWDHKYEAISFTPTSDGTVYGASVRLKYVSGNYAYFYGVYIYSDNAGTPNAALCSVNQQDYFHIATNSITSYTEFYFSFAGQAVTAGTKYWLVLYKYDTESVIHLNSNNSGTNDHYYSADATSWTVNATARCYVKVYSSKTAGISIDSKTWKPLQLSGGSQSLLNITCSPTSHALDLTTSVCAGINISGGGEAFRAASTAANYAATITNSASSSYALYLSAPFALYPIGSNTSILIDIPLTAVSGIQTRALGTLTANHTCSDFLLTRTFTRGSYSVLYPILTISDETTAPETPLAILIKKGDVTSTVFNLASFRHNTSGTAAAGFGAGILGQLQSSTTANQDAAQIAWSWTDVNHATRTSKLAFSNVYNAGSLTERLGLLGTEAVFNDGGNDYDTRIESDTEPNMLVVDAGTDTNYFGGTTNGMKVVKGGTASFIGTARFFVPQVTDAGPMTATDGTKGEVVYNLSDDKFYGCTATGTPATWAALN